MASTDDAALSPSYPMTSVRADLAFSCVIIGNFIIALVTPITWGLTMGWNFSIQCGA